MVNGTSTTKSQKAAPREERSTLRAVVIGGTGLIGSKLITKLRASGHEAIPASPNTGVNTLTGEGLDEVLQGASVVVDVSNSPSFEDAAVMKFFETSNRNLLAAEVRAGVRHHVALSVVGTDRLNQSGYMRAKLKQEELIKKSSIPYSILHATQFFEFVKPIGDGSADGNTVRLPPVLFQPIASDDVATALETVATGEPLNGMTEVAGPEQFRLDELVRRTFATHKDPRPIVTDPQARYFGAEVQERSMLPGDGARIGDTTLDEWLSRQGGQK